MTLLKETLKFMEEHGQHPEDVVFIGSESGYSCSWEEFKTLADFEYDSDYGAQIVATDLEIVFADDSRMYREEDDGAEWWEYIEHYDHGFYRILREEDDDVELEYDEAEKFHFPEKQYPILRLYSDKECWVSLEEIHQQEKQ